MAGRERARERVRGLWDLGGQAVVMLCSVSSKYYLYGRSFLVNEYSSIGVGLGLEFWIGIGIMIASSVYTIPVTMRTSDLPCPKSQ